MSKIIVVAGPTASGKSDFAVELAIKHNGEVVSVDSRQIYRKLDIGSGKITPEEMKDIPHHMLSVYDLSEHLNIGIETFTRDALEIIEDIISRNKTPILCGGTGYYMNALIYETTFTNVPPNQELRESLKEKTCEELMLILSSLDKARADNIDSKNKRRIIRAIEIAKQLGSVPHLKENKLRYEDTQVYLMNVNRDTLKQRIEKRIHKKMEGMLKEIEQLRHEYDDELLISLGLEYKHITKFLKGDYTSLSKTIELLANDTYHYAKRQITWNKKYLRDAVLVEVKE